MAFDPAPSTWLGAGYTLASHVAGFNTNDASSNKLLTQLTDAQANATTGDIRTVAMALSEALFQAWLAQSTPDRPAKMTLAKSTTGGSDGTSIYTYTFRFYVDPVAFTPASE